MADQNNAPERIWIKPCDPCETPYDYYVCDPRYLDGRETSYVKSVVSCAGCGGGLRRHSGQFVCRDCGKAETVQEVLPHADRAAPEGQVGALRDAHALTPPPAAQEPVAWMYELATMIDAETGEYGGWGGTKLGLHKPDVPEGSIRNLTPLYAAPPPACQQEAVTVMEALAEERAGLCAHTGGPDGACSETIKRIDAALRALKGEDHG